MILQMVKQRIIVPSSSQKVNNNNNNKNLFNVVLILSVSMGVLVWKFYVYILFPRMTGYKVTKNYNVYINNMTKFTIEHNMTIPQNYCEWNNNYNDNNDAGLQNCFNMLAPILQSKPIWIFMGDSNMYFMTNELQKIVQNQTSPPKNQQQQQQQQQLHSNNNDNKTHYENNNENGNGTDTVNDFYFNDNNNNTATKNSRQQQREQQREQRKRQKMNRYIKVKESSRCNRIQEYYFPGVYQEKDISWEKPNQTLVEGPDHFGMIQPFCTDCSRCHNKKIVAGGNTTMQQLNSTSTFTQLRYMEYLALEFTRDVSFPTPYTKTSQETVAYYLSSQRHNNHNNYDHKSKNTTTFQQQVVCVASIGHHDMKINHFHHTTIYGEKLPDLTPRQYANRVYNFIMLLLLSSSSSSEKQQEKQQQQKQQPACDFIIWMTMTATMDDPKRLQQNWNIDRWNNEVFIKLLLLQQQQQQQTNHSSNTDSFSSSSLLNDQFFFVNVNKYSKTTPHRDNIHMTIQDYYIPLANLFSKLIIDQEQSNK